MTTATPPYRQTCALAQATRLADLFCPTNDEERAAHHAMTTAIRSGDLHGAVKAIRAARVQRGVSTAEWAEWAASWLSKVDRLIMGGA